MLDRKIVVVTGSSGNIGDAVMRRFGSRAEDTVGFDRDAADPPPPDCTFIPVDVTSDDSVMDGIRVIRHHHGRQIGAVIHLAAYYDFSGEENPLYDEVTVEGTRRLLRGLNSGEVFVEQFIFSSTMLLHRPGERGQLIDEDWPVEPTWAYPRSKAETEQVVREERGAIAGVCLRIAGVYDDQCHSIPLSHQIKRIYERQFSSHFYPGETAHGQSFVHLDDVVDAIESTVDRRSELPPEIAILIGEPETLSYGELQQTIGRLIHGEEWKTQTLPAALAKAGAWLQEQIPGEDPFIKPWMVDRANDHYALNIERARKLLQWKPKRSLRETLPKMVKALVDDPEAWYRENNLEPHVEERE
jgi:nucleoside-diphosphate-sugar epimerase